MNKYALIGLGFISPRHKRAIENTGGKIVLTCDTNYAEKKPDYSDWIEMFRSPRFAEVDTVVICTPNFTHGVIAREALRLGKRVLCEKPLVLDGFEGLEGVNVVLQLRYNSLVKGLKLSGTDNEISIVVKTYREPAYFRSWKGDPVKSGGILYNMGIHYLDLLQHLLGGGHDILEAKTEALKATGKIRFYGGIGSYHIELLTKPAPVERKISVNGTLMDLEGATIPLADTGEVLDLHTEVYKAMNAGEGIGLEEAKKSLTLVQNILKFNK